MTTELAAYTPPSGVFPPYINISITAEGIRVIVRGEPTEPQGYPQAGPQAAITLDREVMKKLLNEALEKLK